MAESFNNTPEFIRNICVNYNKTLNLKINGSNSTSLTFNNINNIDVAWMLSASILVMLMTPAVGFFYGGLVKKTSILFIMSQCFSIFAVVSLIWALVGYSMAFGPSWGGIIGDPTKYFALMNLSNESKCSKERKMKNLGEDHFPYAQSCNIPETLFFIFQAKFAGITPTLIVGAMSDRMKFHNIIIFMSIWILFVYCPLTHWIWNDGGWLNTIFSIQDFAGGTVVHMAAGFSSLAIALFLGKRNSEDSEIESNNIPMMVLGTMLLWFGWFGFNGGSSFQADSMAVNAILSTNLAATGGMCSWMLCELINTRRNPTIIGISLGTICGLISITPVAGNIYPFFGIFIGAIGSIFSFLISKKCRWLRNKVDDLDIFACHGISGLWGTLSAALFSTKQQNFYLYRMCKTDEKCHIIYDVDGIFYQPSFKRLAFQTIGTIVTSVYSLVMTLAILLIVKKLGMKIRANLVNIDQEFLPPRVSIEDDESNNVLEPEETVNNDEREESLNNSQK